MADDERTQETQESPALGENGEISFSTEQAEAVGDEAAAGTGPADAGESPADAQERGSAAAEQSPAERPELQIVAAFVGAFVVAKLLQRLFGRD